MKTLEEIKAYADKAHNDTNQKYGEHPYTYHTHAVASVAERFYDECFHNDAFKDVAIASAYCHDLIEDARETYNDVKNATFSTRVAEVVYALTNEKGRTRKERGNAKYYQGIRESKIASFVKLCDRVANVENGKVEGSKMFMVYHDEHKEFMENVVGGWGIVFKPIIDHLNGLFDEVE